MATDDQGFVLQSAGQADWDSALNANFNVAERGFHITGLAGASVRTGDVVWINSANFMFPFNPNSLDVRPHGLAYYSVGSGESIKVVGMGIVRSLAVHSAAVPGLDLYVSPATPGAVVASYSAASRRIGFGVSEQGVYFQPNQTRFAGEILTRNNTVTNAVVGSTQFFSLDVGKTGVVRQVYMKGASADLVTLQFFSGSTRASSERLFETLSGGLTVVGSYIDRAMFPYENTEANTLSGLIFGSLKIMSGCLVTSDTIGVELVVQRVR